MTEVVSVRFKSRGKSYYFDPKGHQVRLGQNVIVETSKGLEFGECVRGNFQVEPDKVIPPLRPVVRLATAEDMKTEAANREKEQDAFRTGVEKIRERGLDMKLVDVEYNFEGNKILFFFTSDGRVDFRELVRDLAGIFRTRIELRQIGVRDEAKMLGGLGVCGKQFCCTQFLTEFHPVSIKMAKIQGLSLNPAKISGTCGRLMCCLKYEEIAYEDLVKKAPKVDAFVETPSGKGSVINVNLLRGNAKVRLEDGFDTTLKTFTFDEIDVLGGKGRRAEYIAAKAEGRLEEAGFSVSPPPEIRRTFDVAPPPPSRGNRQNTRDGRPASDGPPNKHSPRHDRKPSADHKKKPNTGGGERQAKNVSPNAPPQRQQPPDGTQAKKPYAMRRRGGRGKS